LLARLLALRSSRVTCNKQPTTNNNQQQVKQVDSLAGQARGMLKGMAHRANRKKTMMRFLMVLMLGAVLVALYYVLAD
jgi:hypothetical protein